MPYSRVFIPGDRLVDCDICGFTRRRSEMRKGTTGSQKGFAVCPDCLDQKHPNDERIKNRPEGRLEEIQ